MRVCGPVLASRLCPLSRQCPGQPSPRPAAPPRLTRLLLTPTGEHSLCVSSLPWDGDRGRGPRGGGRLPWRPAALWGGGRGRTLNPGLSSPLNGDSRIPRIRIHPCSGDTAESLPGTGTQHLSKHSTKRETEARALPARCRYAIPTETFHLGNPETLRPNGISRSSHPEMSL